MHALSPLSLHPHYYSWNHALATPNEISTLNTILKWGAQDYCLVNTTTVTLIPTPVEKPRVVWEWGYHDMTIIHCRRNLRNWQQLDTFCRSHHVIIIHSEVATRERYVTTVIIFATVPEIKACMFLSLTGTCIKKKGVRFQLWLVVS